MKESRRALFWGGGSKWRKLVRAKNNVCMCVCVHAPPAISIFLPLTEFHSMLKAPTIDNEAMATDT